jgi:hypothetical protein
MGANLIENDPNVSLVLYVFDYCFLNGLLFVPKGDVFRRACQLGSLNESYTISLLKDKMCFDLCDLILFILSKAISFIPHLFILEFWFCLIGYVF